MKRVTMMFYELLTATSLSIKATQNHINQNLLEELISLEYQQLEKLQSIQQNIESLQLGPFHSGMACLEDAKKEHRTDKERSELVLQAKQHFITSFGTYEAKSNKNLNDYYVLGYIQSYIGLSWLLLGGILDFNDWLIKSKTNLDHSLELHKIENNRLREHQNYLYEIFKEKENKHYDPSLIFKPSWNSVLKADNEWLAANETWHKHNWFGNDIKSYRDFVNQSLELLEKGKIQSKQ